MPNLIVQLSGSLVIIFCGYLYGEMNYPMISLIAYGGGIIWIYYNLQVFFMGKPQWMSFTKRKITNDEL